MVNQSMSSRKRVLDCSPIKPSLKKRPTSEVSESRPQKRVSFSVQTPIKPSLKKRPTSEVSKSRPHKRVSFSVQTTEPSKGHHDGMEVPICRHESRGKGNDVHSLVLKASISITNKTDNREKSSSLPVVKSLPIYSRGVKSQSEFSLDSSKSAKGVRSRREFSHASTRSAEGVKSQSEFIFDSTKIAKGRKQSVFSTPCHKNGPMKNITWSGIVEVVECGKIRMCEEMIAHLSFKVSRKAFECSKKINSKLQFKLFPRSDLYPKKFQDACPDRDDIALYFYPTKAERSKREYSELLKHMKYLKLMMWTQIDGRELLVYPSTILTPDSQKLEDSYFMWGVFGRRKYEFDIW